MLIIKHVHRPSFTCFGHCSSVTLISTACPSATFISSSFFTPLITFLHQAAAREHAVAKPGRPRAGGSAASATWSVL